MPHRVTDEEMAAMLKSPGVIVHYSRCMYCGQRTPHEVCHTCCDILTAGENPFDHAPSVGDDGEWFRFDNPPEVCAFDDEHCPIVVRHLQALQ